MFPHLHVAAPGSKIPDSPVFLPSTSSLPYFMPVRLPQAWLCVYDQIWYLPTFLSVLMPPMWLINNQAFYNLNNTEANRSTSIHFSNVQAQNWNLIFCMEKKLLNRSWIPVSEKIPELNVQLFSILHLYGYTILTILQIKKRSCPEGRC